MPYAHVTSMQMLNNVNKLVGNAKFHFQWNRDMLSFVCDMYFACIEICKQKSAVLLGSV